MTQQLINIGHAANDRSGDPLRTAFDKINQNFTELYAATGADAPANELINGAQVISLGSDGILTFPNGETIVSQAGQIYIHKDDGAAVGEVVVQPGSVGIQAVSLISGNNRSSLVQAGVNGIVNSVVTAKGNTLSWEFTNIGTVNTPLLLPTSFTAVLDDAHMVNPVGFASPDPWWEYGVEFQVNPNGTVQTLMDDPVRLTNPGYVDGYTFRFTEADHGIPDFVFDITLTTVTNVRPAGWTAGVAVTQPPVYPATFASTGAIKLKASSSSWIFTTDGKIQLPTSGDIVDSFGNSVIAQSNIDGGDASSSF